MGRPNSLLNAFGLAVAVAGCSVAQAPEELAGLWSSGQGACEAGVGVRFERDAIRAEYEDQSETLFDQPDYAVEPGGAGYRVRIRYELPARPGGARAKGAYGLLVLERSPEGGLQLASHNLLDPRTGAARARIAADPAETLMRLTPCGDHPWREQLRGRGVD